jgi:dUTP pyrophosphatase
MNRAIRIPITRLPSGAGLPLPEYFSAGAAGLDLSAALQEPLPLERGAWHAVPCGFAVAIPAGYEGQIRPRSGLASRHGVTILNAPGTIDSDYRGEVKALVVNHGRETFVVTPGLRIAQLIVAPVALVEWDPVDELPATSRGAGGFGHTG